MHMNSQLMDNRYSAKFVLFRLLMIVNLIIHVFDFLLFLALNCVTMSLKLKGYTVYMYMYTAHKDKIET